MTRRTRPVASASSAALLVLALAGCGDESPEPASFDRAWTVPDDVCDRLDLPGLLAENGVPGAEAGKQETAQGSVTCTASGQEDVTVRVVFRSVTDRAGYDLAWENAVNQIAPSSVWESLGPVETATPAPADWPGESYARRFTSIQSGGGDLRDTTRVARVEALGDANVVISVGVQATSAGRPETLVERVDGLGDAAAARLTTTLDRAD